MKFQFFDMFDFLKKKIVYNIVFFLIVLFYVFTRVLMYIKYGQIAFGYDTGIYRHYIIGYFERFGDKTLVPFGFSYFSNLFRSLGFSVHFIMYDLYILISVGILLSFFFVVKLFTNNKYTALVAMFLYSISIVQFEFYWWYYYRNFLALFLIFISFILLKYKSYWVSLSLVVIGTIHPISYFFVVLCGLFYSFFDKEKRRFIWISGVLSLFLVLLINFREWQLYLVTAFGENGFTFKSSGTMNEFSGQFISNDFFWRQVIFYLPLSIWGFCKFWKKQILFTVFTIVSLALLILQVLFYKRVFVFVDVAIIFFASLGLTEVSQFFLDKKKVWKFVWFVFLIIYTVLLSFLLFGYVSNKQTLISENDFSALDFIDYDITPGSYLLTVSSNYGPWLYGFTNARVIAPGLFENDKWSIGDWNIFWYSNSQEKIKDLLRVYNTKTIYVYVGEKFNYFSNILKENDMCQHLDIFLWQCNLE